MLTTTASAAVDAANGAPTSAARTGTAPMPAATSACQGTEPQARTIWRAASPHAAA